jgi:hypothetical protein
VGVSLPCVVLEASDTDDRLHQVHLGRRLGSTRRLHRFLQAIPLFRLLVLQHARQQLLQTMNA